MILMALRSTVRLQLMMGVREIEEKIAEKVTVLPKNISPFELSKMSVIFCLSGYSVVLIKNFRNLKLIRKS